MLCIKGAEVDLPITKDNMAVFSSLVGKSSYRGYAGVYVFTHKISGSMYVGSSNLLRRRMDYYLKGDFPLVGKFLPLLKKEGFSNFKLKVYKLDLNIFKLQDAFFLEQYML